MSENDIEPAMRTHTDIIRDAGGYQAVALKLHFEGRVETVKSWAVRNNIPAEHWRGLVDRGLATADELMTGAAMRKRRAA